MPLIWQTEQPQETHIAVWHMTESWQTLESVLPAGIIDRSKPDTFALEQNYIQWLATRTLLGHLLRPYQTVELYKSEHGKLKVASHEELYISVSHTLDYAAVSVSNRNTGIDIETKLEKIDRIKHKFMNDEEKKWAMSSEDALLIWCGKESLYKLYEEKEMDFIQHMTIQKNTPTFVGHIHKGNLQQHFNLYTRHTPEYMMAWVTETII